MSDKRKGIKQDDTKRAQRKRSKKTLYMCCLAVVLMVLVIAFLTFLESKLSQPVHCDPDDILCPPPSSILAQIAS